MIAANFARHLLAHCGCGKKPSATARHALEIDPYACRSACARCSAVFSNGSGDINKAQRVLATFPAENKILVTSTSAMSGPCTGDRAYVFVLARDFEAALKVWETAGDTAVDQRRRLSARARDSSPGAAISSAHKPKRRKRDKCWRRDYASGLTTFLR